MFSGGSQVVQRVARTSGIIERKGAMNASLRFLNFVGTPYGCEFSFSLEHLIMDECRYLMLARHS